jgi:hypothetical protein
MEHSVVVENVTAYQLRDAVGIGREESDANNLGHEPYCRAQPSARGVTAVTGSADTQYRVVMQMRALGRLLAANLELVRVHSR